MKPDDFEKQLQHRPLRDVPPEWRGDILASARASSITCASHPTPQASLWWREWLWPAPQAWAGLAAVWLVILGLNLTPAGPETSAIVANVPAASTNLFEQRRELARLLDNALEPEPVRKSPTPPGPRSERLAPPRV